MSASASTFSAKQMTLEPTETNSQQQVTDISVTARIDYNLRFSKQAVFVLGETTAKYSDLASQYLANLSDKQPPSEQFPSEDEHINVAFISSSNKLNDIQIRCRLIEQLFVNTLFDPEQSLAVSVLKFARQYGKAIAVLVDHAHSLSLQIKYELCQLSSLAKKHKLTINVVFFGLAETGQQLALNKSLFIKKLAIIDADSGQVINLNSSHLVNKVSKNNLSLWQKLSLVCTALLIISACIWLYSLIIEDITQQEKLNESAIIASKSNFKHALDSKIITDKENLVAEPMQANYKPPSSKESKVDSQALSTSQATSEDIYQALSLDRTIAREREVPAQVEEVLHAIAVANNEEPSKISTKDSNLEILTKADGAKELSNGHYYQEKAKQYPDGYVLQIAGFTNVKLSERFLELKSSENLYHYHKNLAGQKFTVVTSKVFMNKVEANNALLKLPKPLLDRKPWLKPISSVINEINTFKQ
jgi:DamX protein